jgi:hypothetical protein
MAYVTVAVTCRKPGWLWKMVPTKGTKIGMGYATTTWK